MKGFKLDRNGDIEIQTVGAKREIQMVDGNKLIRQTVQSVLGTNRGEWPLNLQEGITFSNILGKQIEEDAVRNEIQQGLIQVDSSFILTAFTFAVNSEARTLKITFTAQNGSGNEISGVTQYAQ